MMTLLVEYIATDDRRGKGTEDSPIRLVTQLWTKDGRLVAEFDPECPQRSWFKP